MTTDSQEAFMSTGHTPYRFRLPKVRYLVLAAALLHASWNLAAKGVT